MNNEINNETIEPLFEDNDIPHFAIKCDSNSCYISTNEFELVDEE